MIINSIKLLWSLRKKKLKLFHNSEVDSSFIFLLFFCLWYNLITLLLRLLTRPRFGTLVNSYSLFFPLGRLQNFSTRGKTWWLSRKKLLLTENDFRFYFFSRLDNKRQSIRLFRFSSELVYSLIIKKTKPTRGKKMWLEEKFIFHFSSSLENSIGRRITYRRKKQLCLDNVA